MAAAVIYMHWDSYAGAGQEKAFFENDPLTFNSRQERLHELARGDELWLVSRFPSDKQYYFVGLIWVEDRRRNDPASELGSRFGEFAVVAAPTRSPAFGKDRMAYGLLY